MNDKAAIPVMIGVTGHRGIRRQDEPAIRAAVKSELEKLQTLCPHSPLVMLSSLAEGGDLLCADVAEELGIPLIAALPRERTDYERDFSAEALARFPITAAVQRRSSSRRRPRRFRTVALAGTSNSVRPGSMLPRTVISCWRSGTEDPGKYGCGTAEAVDFALNGSYTPESGMPLRSESNEAVIHIFTPRGERTGRSGRRGACAGERGRGSGCVLRKTDDFNQNARRSLFRVQTPGFPRTGMATRYWRGWRRSAGVAGKLSRQYAARYRRVLALLAVASALLTFAFLMYDEAQAIWMILVCGAMLLAAWGCQRYAVRSDCHRRYIEYRALAECLRVQTYLRYAGSGIQASGLLSWTQQEETAWILDALCALTIGKKPETKHDIRTCWVECAEGLPPQGGKASGQKLSASDRTVRLR